MTAKRKSRTMARVTNRVKKAAKAVARTADEYVVAPIGKALGLAKKTRANGRTKPTSRRKSMPKKRALARSRQTG